MKIKPLLFILALALIWGCSRHSTGCPDWYEGQNCQTPMRQKWIGTFIGTTRVNANTIGYADTFIFVADSTRIDYDHCVNKNFDLSIRNTREASFNDGTGIGVVSEDGKDATLTYTNTFFILNSDSSLYTFTGTKQ